jgi:hypothetical protein
VLTSSSLKTLPLLLLGSERRYHEIADAHADDDEAAPGLTYRKAIGALAEREFDRAARLFAAARAGDPSLARVGLYEVFALASAHRVADARSAFLALSEADRAQVSAANLDWLWSFAAGGSVMPIERHQAHGVLSE